MFVYFDVDHVILI